MREREKPVLDLVKRNEGKKARSLKESEAQTVHGTGLEDQKVMKECRMVERREEGRKAGGRRMALNPLDICVSNLPAKALGWESFHTYNVHLWWRADRNSHWVFGHRLRRFYIITMSFGLGKIRGGVSLATGERTKGRRWI